MAHKGSDVYDDEEFFSRYIAKRRRLNSPNDLLEEPIIDELLAEVAGKELLDLGCGDGRYAAKLLGQGLKSYRGIDASENMIRLAQEHLLEFAEASVERQTLEEITVTRRSYDILLSRLVLHYLEDLAHIFAVAHQSLREGGCFIFSVEHPIITSNYAAYNQQAKVKREDWVVDNYFHSGQRINKWIGKEVIKYHRTLEEYVRLIQKSGFALEEIRESKPARANFAEQTEYDRRMRIPLFLLFKVRRVS
ncbi:MAG: methyltransferase domain-containing protein [Bacteroidota bacterium]